MNEQQSTLTSNTLSYFGLSREQIQKLADKTVKEHALHLVHALRVHDYDGVNLAALLEIFAGKLAGAAPETSDQPPPNRNHDKDCPCYECANLRMCRVCGRTGGLHNGCTEKADLPLALPTPCATVYVFGVKRPIDSEPFYLSFTNQELAEKYASRCTAVTAVSLYASENGGPAHGV